MPAPHTFLAWSLLASLGYLAALTVAAITTALRAGGRREETIAHGDTRAVSRFTIPVSIIVPITARDTTAAAAMAALLNLNYPELEIIAIIDGKKAAGALTALMAEWRLDAHEFFFRRSIATTAVRRIYRSGRDERVMVLDVPTETRGEAINAGINVARYRYVTVVAPAVEFDRNALLRVMTAPLRDPSTIVGASAHLERTGRFARLASTRSLAASLLFWRHLPCSPPPADAVCVWRRDAVLEANGFSGVATDPELDMARRLLLGRADGGSGRFYRSGELFGTCPHGRGASRVLPAVQFARALTPSGVRAFGAAGLAAFFGVELLAPLAQAWAVIGTVWGAFSGDWSWVAPALVVALLAIGRAAVTSAALLTRGSAPSPPEGAALTRLLTAAPFEIFLNRFSS